jgi:ubiquinone/menaquinone biosynthesis C-methylase UbiE
MSSDRTYWDEVYATKAVDEVSWFEASPRTSLEMIEALGLPPDAPILDVGGGASHLAEELLALGHSDITVVDISGEALWRAREGFPDPDRVTWIVADVRDHDFGRRFSLWHDRGAFHFMVSAEDRSAYLATLGRSLEPGGHVILATFGPEGPDRCSGLPVARYSAEALAEEIGEIAELGSWQTNNHRTPSGATQQFLFAHLVAGETPS